jgi:peroxiredoxin
MNQPPTSENARSVVPAPVSFPAPELTLSRLDGQAESLDDYLGQVVLINNWATWCPPCKAEMPDLQAYYVEHKDQGFSVVAISAADAENDVRTFVEQYQLSFPVWLDPQNQALSAFRNQSLPSSYVVDRTGTVRLAWTGVISRDMLEEYLTPLLEE